MPFQPFSPQLVEVRTPTVGTLEHQHVIQSVTELWIPAFRRRIYLLPDQMDHRAHYTFHAQRDEKDERPQWFPEEPEEMVDESVPATPEDPPQRRDLHSSFFGFGRAHVATS